MNNALIHPVIRSWHGWIPLILLPLAVVGLFPVDGPKWALMWSLAGAIYIGCKWLTWRRTPRCNAPLWKHLGYLLAWPGLDAATFLRAAMPLELRRCSFGEWLFAVGKTLLGMATLFVLPSLVPSHYPVLVGWIGMVGIVMTLHFGLFHVLSCLWRSAGVNARPLMNEPLASTGISEFWGRRWNTAFRDITNRFLFRPLTARYGATIALFASFLASGLIHDLVISVPARAGYGGPTLFFVVQSLAIFASRSKLGRSLGLETGVQGRLFTAIVLLAPLTFLFHRAFVLDIMVPFMKAVGAL